MSNEAASVDARALLEQERDDLRRQLAELGFGDSGGLEYDPNFADSSQVTAERGEAEVLANKLRDTLADVEAALQKLEAGTYGVCEGCGKDIQPARLEAFPAAVYCIDCASSRR
ncbi:MAG: TraR/DksA C4-type zinc finger protein [Actinomycetota bacterium]|nr:TraR/DksA C4-type zinc finger protein [Actinomycetota bacterium]